MAVFSQIPGSASVSSFTPSVNGLQFTNSFPHEAAVTIPLRARGSFAIGDASNGLCGGMVFTVRHVFQTAGMAPLADPAQPPPGSPLFSYIVDRLIASVDLPQLGFRKYYEWMITPTGTRAGRPSSTGGAWPG